MKIQKVSVKDHAERLLAWVHYGLCSALYLHSVYLLSLLQPLFSHSTWHSSCNGIRVWPPAVLPVWAISILCILHIVQLRHIFPWGYGVVTCQCACSKIQCSIHTYQSWKMCMSPCSPKWLLCVSQGMHQNQAPKNDLCEEDVCLLPGGLCRGLILWWFLGTKTSKCSTLPLTWFKQTWLQISLF